MNHVWPYLIHTQYRKSDGKYTILNEGLNTESLLFIKVKKHQLNLQKEYIIGKCFVKKRMSVYLHWSVTVLSANVFVFESLAVSKIVTKHTMVLYITELYLSDVFWNTIYFEWLWLICELFLNKLWFELVTFLRVPVISHYTFCSFINKADHLNKNQHQSEYPCFQGTFSTPLVHYKYIDIHQNWISVANKR